MTSKRVRMVDVAAAAGVSQTTASFVLNGRDSSIPEETRRRVLEAAERLGYQPNATARALVTGRTQRIGIVLNVPESFGTRDLYFTNVLSGIVSSAPRFDYNVLLHTAHYPDWKALFNDIVSGSTDGVLLIGRYTGDELTTALLNAGFPTVCISYHIDHAECRYVDCENEQGAYVAMRHLLALGHREVAVFFPGQNISWGQERYAGALRALREAGLSQEHLQVFEWEETALPTEEWCQLAVEFLKTGRPRPTALLCCEETRALRISELWQEAGFSIPKDLALISFNSTELSRRARPPLTSVWQPLSAIGEGALEMLIDRIEGRNRTERKRLYPMRLDVRFSCGARKRERAEGVSEDRLPSVRTEQGGGDG
jgi:DNA-binding LacI/PurR family transcriptional regulator